MEVILVGMTAEIVAYYTVHPVRHTHIGEIIAIAGTSCACRLQLS
jgi:hypothetical protein